jgi:hypothetical protein
MSAPNLGQGIGQGNYRLRKGITPPAVQGKAAGAVAQTVFFNTATGPVTHDTNGALTGPGSSIAGSAARVAGPVTHATTGTLTGQGTTLAGAATRFRAHPTSGVLAGQGSVLAGAARHNIPHAASGTLAGQGATLAGSAARTRAHAAAGVLAGPGAIIVGSALRIGAPVTHDTSGALIGQQSVIVGDATLIDPPRGGGGPGNAQAVVRNRKRGWANERAQFEQSQQIRDITQTLEQSDQPQAQRIARKLADYTGEIAQIESLQRELAKLEAAQRSRLAQTEMEREVQAAAAELQSILRDDEDVADALMALHEYEARLLVVALGIATR